MSSVIHLLKMLVAKSQQTFLTPKDGMHSLLDDAQGMLTGTMIMSLGIVLFKVSGIYTGGVTGLALLLHYVSDLPLGWLLMLINIPFYIMAYRRFGRVFTLKSLLAVSLLALFISLIPIALLIESVNPYFAAVVGGLLVGTGLIQLFRHRSSTGGFNVLVLYFQDKYGWNAGLVQMLLDFVVIGMSMMSGELNIIMASFLGAAVMNLAISVNHRPGRYISF